MNTVCKDEDFPMCLRKLFSSCGKVSHWKMTEENCGASKRVPLNESQLKEKIIASIKSSCDHLSEGFLDLLDYKIVDTVLKEMIEAFELFKPYRGIRKITIFGSARTSVSDPLYLHTKELASRAAEKNWMVVTGAGPGIMAAGIEGASAEHAIGVNIRLPHEQQPNAFIASDPKLVQMRYFFTRKLMLIKESSAYVFLPGGFGTLDEAFELLTLLQTGKTPPAPVIFLDVKGDDYFDSLDNFIREHPLKKHYISAYDTNFYYITNSVEAALNRILEFYENYHSMRWVGKLLVLRMRKAPSKATLDALAKSYNSILTSGTIKKIGPTQAEKLDGDCLDMERISLYFNKIDWGKLVNLIWELN